jgi:hypothetical protein
VVAHAHAAARPAAEPGGVLVVRPVPVSATVIVDGLPLAVEDGRASRTFDAPGSHVHSVAAPGHRPREREFPVEHGRSVVVPVRLVRAPRPAPLRPLANAAADEFKTFDPWTAR